MKIAGTVAAVGFAVAALTAPRAESPSGFAPIATLVNDAIARHDLPGAVVLVGRDDDVVYHQAFGRRAVAPAAEAMTEDTIFDLASLTKVVATTTSVMQLVEQGRVRLSDPASRYVGEFARPDKEKITIAQLLTHTSGLPPDLPLEVEFSGAEEAIRRAAAIESSAPGERFVYSDINFFVLGAIVQRVTGERLDAYAAAHVFRPLAMHDTMFTPPERLWPRIAPTERCRPLQWPCGSPEVPFLRGIVHDPTARRMDRVAGHAGLFSTAADLSRFCRMLLHGGALDGVRVLSPATIARMIRPSTPAGMKDVRGLGWDIDSTYSSNRGELFPLGSFGHTGFTGTSLWLDPSSSSYVVFLSNRVHPDGKGDVTPLRANVATVAAAALLTQGDVERSAKAVALQQAPAARARGFSRATHAPTLAGIDVLEAEGFARLRGKRLALLTNQSGRTRRGASTIDVLAHAPGVTLVALFSPEHGIRGTADAAVDSTTDSATGLPIHSLYGATDASRHPTPQMLTGIDAIVIDLQDVGARFYTYPAAIAYVMEEAAKHHVAVIVLDRPNPVGGQIEGPSIDPSTPAYIGYMPMPIRHGLTIGELAALFNAERKLGADLTVVPMQHWQRDEWFDETGLPWVNPSPNMRSLTAATLYPGVGALEYTNVSVGRGTDTPFEQIGAPWIDGAALAEALNARAIPGIRFYPVTFTPANDAKLGGETCQGVFMIVTDRDALRPVRVGLEIASALARMYGQRFTLESTTPLLGPASLIARIRAGDAPDAIAASWQTSEDEWRALTARYLLY